MLHLTASDDKIESVNFNMVVPQTNLLGMQTHISGEETKMTVAETTMSGV